MELKEIFPEGQITEETKETDDTESELPANEFTVEMLLKKSIEHDNGDVDEGLSQIESER